MALKNIIYLSVENYVALKETGTVIINGRTITYSEDDFYCVPDETQEQIADLQAEQAVQGAKITTLQSAVDNLLLEEAYPLYSKEGNPVNSRYVQFPDQPEPAEIFGGQWELDQDAMDKFLVGAGNLYTLGATGGSADAVVVEHTHTFEYLEAAGSYVTADGYTLQRGYAEDTRTNIYNQDIIAIASTGEDGTNKNLPPYLAVNIWKRTA